MKTLLHGFEQSSNKKSIDILEERNIIEVVAWIGRKKFCDVNIMELRYLKNVSGFQVNFDTKIYETIYEKCFIKFMQMYTRLNHAYYNNYQEIVNSYNLYFNYFYKLLFDRKIELVMFNNITHFGLDYMLYELAKELNIKTLLCVASPIPNRFYYLEDLNDYGKYNEMPKYFLNENFKTIEKKYEKSHFYMKNIPMQHKSCCFNFFNDFRRSILRRVNSKSLFDVMKSLQDCLAYKKNLNSLVQKTGIDLKEYNYVYFPLHLQPEMTTSAIGGRYDDQILALEKLRKLLPNDWYIFVKENPKQLQEYRGRYFFKRLKGINNLKLFDKTYNTYDLLTNAKFTATITGTVGWESICGGKPVLLFGDIWYMNFPGVCKYEETTMLEDILSIDINHKKLEESYNEMINYMLPGVANPGYEVLVEDYNEDENSKTVALSLETILLDY